MELNLNTVLLHLNKFKLSKLNILIQITKKY